MTLKNVKELWPSEEQLKNYIKQVFRFLRKYFCRSLYILLSMCFPSFFPPLFDGVFGCFYHHFQQYSALFVHKNHLDLTRLDIMMTNNDSARFSIKKFIQTDCYISTSEYGESRLSLTFNVSLFYKI